MKNTIGIGILGLGWVSSQYIKSFLKNEYTSIKGVCVRNYERGKNTLKQYGLENCSVFVDLDAMLETERIDAVCILTPNYLHVQQAIKCAEAGKHLLIEKPIALNWDEAKLLNSTLQTHKVKNTVGFVLRWNSLFKNIKSILHRGMIGNIFHIEIDYMFHLDQSLKCYSWCSKKHLGGSILIQSGCHAVDGVYFFKEKKVQEVIAISTKNRDDYDHETTYSIHLRFEDGTTGKIFCSYDTVHPYVYDINIYGNRGSIRKNLVYSKEYFPGQVGWVSMPSIMPDTEDVEHHPFPELVDHFVDCVRKDKMPSPCVGDVMHVFEIIEAAERSAQKNGQPVKLPLD
jgi:predicted dehydrogenase